MSGGKRRVLDNPLSLPVGQGSGALSICKPAGCFTVPGPWAPTEPISLHSYQEDWTWTTVMYPTSVLFSWPKAKIIPVTQEGNCWLLNRVGYLFHNWLTCMLCYSWIKWSIGGVTFWLGGFELVVKSVFILISWPMDQICLSHLKSLSHISVSIHYNLLQLLFWSLFCHKVRYPPKSCDFQLLLSVYPSKYWNCLSLYGMGTNWCFSKQYKMEGAFE